MRVWTVPNMLSAFRLLSGPSIPAGLYYQAHAAGPGEDAYLRAGILALVVLGGISDPLDGWIAKRFKQCSELGKVLDPLADIVFVLCLAAGLFCFYGFKPYTLIAYGIPAAYITQYAVRVSIMRWRGQIVESNLTARKKTGVLLFSLGLLNVAIVLHPSPLMWVFEIPGLLGGVIAMLLSRWALRYYRGEEKE